jgi:DNA polymerase (family 10)
MDNREVAAVFDRIGDLLEVKGESGYRVNAYRRAAESIRSTSEEVEALAKEGRLQEIPGVGEAIAAKIEELLSTGHMATYDNLTAAVPEGLLGVLEIQDVGPKKAARFWKELGITDIDGLEAAARAGRLRELSGMGEKSEARILGSIEAYRRRSGRTSIGVALPVAEKLLGRLRALPGVQRAELGGSLRRWRESIGDIDLLVASDDPEAVTAAFAGFHEVRRIRAQGETKVSVELQSELQAQLWVHPVARFGSAWQYATGSQAHNIRLRERAQAMRLSLSEHGFRRPDGSEVLAADEGHVYNALGLPWIPPELREDRGEVQAAAAGALPALVVEADLRGELHAHSDWSDGVVTIAEMAQAAAEAGLDYLVISDHSQSLGVARGLSVERLREQRREIGQAQKRLGKRIRLLQGAEVEILADGRLDFPDAVLAELDLVIASLHSSLRQSRDLATARLLAAIRHPQVDMIGHPTGRMIEGREGADLDLEAVFEAARENRTILEINAHPDRLDLSDVHARRAADLGCLLAINTDAHRPSDLLLRRYGVGVARRAWLTAAQVANAWPLDDLLSWLSEG